MLMPSVIAWEVPVIQTFQSDKNPVDINEEFNLSWTTWGGVAPVELFNSSDNMQYHKIGDFGVNDTYTTSAPYTMWYSVTLRNPDWMVSDYIVVTVLAGPPPPEIISFTPD